MPLLQWQSADQRVLKTIIKRGKSTETPLDGSRVYLTIHSTKDNLMTKTFINAKKRQDSDILNGDTKKIFIIGESSYVLDRQIEKALRTMTVKEKSLIRILHGSYSEVEDMILTTITLTKMDLHTTGLQWQSANKEVRKEVIKCGESPRTPSQGSTVYLTIEHCIVDGTPGIVGNQQWNSKILDGETRKSFVIGESSCTLDQKIEKALETMTVKEKSLITVVHQSDSIGYLSGAPAIIKFEVTLNKFDLNNSVLHWQSADQKVQKDVIKRGESSKTPVDGSRVYLTMGLCSINGYNELKNLKYNDLNNEWGSEILDDATNRILIIGKASSVLDQQIEKALQTMKVKEKSLITVLHTSNPTDFLIGTPVTIKCEVTLDMMDLQPTDLQWESTDKRIRKEIIKCGKSPRTPTQGSTVYFTIEHCIINGTTRNDAKEQWNTKIIDGHTKKSFTIGKASCVLDQQIEQALKTMTVKEKSLIKVLHGSDPTEFYINAPATIELVVTLNKIDESNTVLQWQSADKKVRKEIIKHGEFSETPMKGSRVYLTMGLCSINGSIHNYPKEEWGSEILDDVTNKIFIIGKASSVLDQQIEKALQTMTVKEKSLIRVQHATNPKDFLKGIASTIEFEVTLDMMDLQTTDLQWESTDKRVRKEVINCGELSRPPAQGSTIHFTIEHCIINGTTRNDAKEQWNTKIIDGHTKKSFTIGKASCVLDQQIEKALKTMTVKEKSLITVLHGSDPIDFLIGAPATIELVVTLNKIDENNTVLQWQSADKKVQKEIIKHGEFSETPMKGSRVYLTMGLCSINGSIHNYPKEEWGSEILDDVTNKIFIIGKASSVLDQQIEKALQTMTVKEKSLIRVQHATNPKDFLKGIASTIEFEVTLDMMDLQTTDLQWESTDKRVRKEVINCGELSRPPAQGSTIHFTIEHCIINGTTRNDAKEQWNTKIIDGDTKKSFTIGKASCVLDQQIEKALQTMTVKEKSLIRVLHATNPTDFLIGAPATIKLVVTLNKIDENNTVLQWQSADKKVRKEIIKHGESSKRPTEGSTVYLTIENCTINGIDAIDCNIDAKQKWNSEILDGGTKKSFIIGESSCALDHQIEKALQMMTVKEKCLITVLHASNSQDRPVAAPATIKVEVTLNKIDLKKPVWDWSPEEKYEVALKYKEIGVGLYKQKRDEDAFFKFGRACKILVTMEPLDDVELEENLKEKINNLRLILYNNMASCQLNRCNFEYVIILCNKVLAKDEKNVKALYRRGIAYGTLHDVEHALADLKRVLSLEPQNSAAKTQYMKYNAIVREANQKSDEMIRRMFKL